VWWLVQVGGGGWGVGGVKEGVGVVGSLIATNFRARLSAFASQSSCSCAFRFLVTSKQGTVLFKASGAHTGDASSIAQ
jgi:hypothetical protein